MQPIIVYEDTDILAVNKPAGLIVHSDGRTVESSLAEWVMEHYPEMKEVGEPWVSPQGDTILRPGIVHRLDRTTSGIMLLAKTNEAFSFLKEQFQKRSIQKEYLAYVYGHMGRDRGVIEKEIVRVKSIPPRWGTARTTDNKKRAAVTEWKTLVSGSDKETGESCTFMSVFPKTGRTHQIRVHLKAINHPVVADYLYATGKKPILGFKRPALHAYRLTLAVPSGVSKTFEAPLPEDFEKADLQFARA